MRLLNEDDVIKTVAMALAAAPQKGAYSNMRKAQEMVKQIPTAELRPLSEDEAETICIIVQADIEEMCRQHRWNEAKEIEQALDKVIYISTKLETLPSAEPQIIRCKDCKYRGKMVCPFGIRQMPRDNDFCFYGKRREE